ncbi:hypothetical protein L7F22_028438 [Adiantum nelumboides]|nr:hypothetical protein [Adiantum nelumboides]
MAASRVSQRVTCRVLRELIVFLLLVVASLMPITAQLIQEAGGAVDHGESLSARSTLRTKLIHDEIHADTVNKEDGSTRDDEWLVAANADPTGTGGLFDALLTSFSMILVSEIGDETFIIAALLAMRHPRSIVLSGALSALIIMTVLSTGLGRIVPNLISRKHTNSAATVLYTFFGLRLLYIAWRSSSKNSQHKELEEVEEKLEVVPQGKTIWRRVLSRFLTPIFLEAFILTFLAEWGDRSQIATIALATHKNAFGVTIGATAGHTICTSLAVVGGRLLALKISQRTVAAVREGENPYEELRNLLLDDTHQSRIRGHAQRQEPPSKEKERSESPDKSMEEDVAPRRRRVQKSPTPPKRKRSPHSPPRRESKKEEKETKKKKERKRSPSSPSSSPSSSSDESGGYSSKESPRRGHRRSHAAWRRSNKLKKFKERGKSISFLTYDGTFGATDKVLAFIQQFDAAFGDEGFTESSKL